MQKGTVYWFTGLSGAGKSTIAALFYQCLNADKQHAVLLDGDQLREIFGAGLGHGIEDRRTLAMRYARLCHLLSEQGLDVVIATISLFHQVQDWNRNHIANYREIYLKVSKQTLIKRDQKQLYSRALAGQQTQVMGIDIPIEEPQNPDLCIENNGEKSPSEIADLLCRHFNIPQLEHV